MIPFHTHTYNAALSGARRASVSCAWFSPQRSGGEVQAHTAQRRIPPRSEAEGGTTELSRR